MGNKINKYLSNKTAKVILLIGLGIIVVNLFLIVIDSMNIGNYVEIGELKTIYNDYYINSNITIISLIGHLRNSTRNSNCF